MSTFIRWLRCECGTRVIIPPMITAEYREEAVELRRFGAPAPIRHGVDIEVTLRYELGQHLKALEALERAADDIRVKIADAAESSSGPSVLIARSIR